MSITEFIRIYLGNHTYSFYFRLSSEFSEYQQRIEVENKEVISWNCTCIFGSAYRFSQKNIMNDTKCKHIHECLNLLIYLGYLK